MTDITLDAINLPGDLVWEDEFEWSAVERSAPEYSLSGAAIFEESIKLAGRPITLVAKSESRGPIWLARSIVLALQNKASLLDQEMTLTLSDAREFKVRFNGDGVKAEPVLHIMPHEIDDRYYLTLSLITTE